MKIPIVFCKCADFLKVNYINKCTENIMFCQCRFAAHYYYPFALFEVYVVPVAAVGTFVSTVGY
ncbi:MAG: hypothetical protein JW725_02325 [Candidatus Babeliaceae bacterium]|nr:hypothetical protein [Candidatus Babeliaceae bacterium]